MSGNANFTEVQRAGAKADRRIVRSRDALGEALIQLMQEKPFDDVTVQDVLDRAGVGRSTFYTHYSGKDDLFFSDVEDFFRMMSTLLTRRNASQERLVPVREFCSHLAEVKTFHTALVESGKLRDVFELGQGYFARSIQERLLLAGVTMDEAEQAVRAHALAGALFAQITWWLNHGMTTTPEAMDTLFHQIAWSGVNPKRS